MAIALPTHNNKIISKVLQSHFNDLVQDLNSNSLVDYLFQESCITKEEKSHIEASKHVPPEQNRKLLNILCTKSDNALDVMMKYLEEDGTQMHFHTRLQESKNKHCRLVLVEENVTESLILPEKWWPEEKPLTYSFIERSITIDAEEKLIVDQIDKQLRVSQTKSTTAITSKKQSIVGMGGIGKTTIAKWYSNIYQGKYTHIIWIDSEGNLLSKSFKLLAKDFDPPVKCDQGFQKTVKDIYNKLKDTKCLFVFDNADGQHGLKNILPKDNEHYSIITSRYQDWGNVNEFGQIPTFALDVFSPLESELFLRKWFKPDESSSSEIEEFGRELGYLPLALQVAVATIKQVFSGYTIASYLERIRHDMSVLMEKRNVLNEYERSISACLQLAIDQIENNETIEKSCKALCKTILYICSESTPDEIPFTLFEERIPDANKYQIRDAVQLLLTYSLISLPNESNIYMFSIHRLLQIVLKKRCDINGVVSTSSTATDSPWSKLVNVITSQYQNTPLQGATTFLFDRAAKLKTGISKYFKS